MTAYDNELSKRHRALSHHLGPGLSCSRVTDTPPDNRHFTHPCRIHSIHNRHRLEEHRTQRPVPHQLRTVTPPRDSRPHPPERPLHPHNSSRIHSPPIGALWSGACALPTRPHCEAVQRLSQADAMRNRGRGIERSGGQEPVVADRRGGVVQLSAERGLRASSSMAGRRDRKCV